MKNRVICLGAVLMLVVSVFAQEKQEQQIQKVRTELEAIRQENLYLKEELQKQEQHLKHVAEQQKLLDEIMESDRNGSEEDAVLQEMEAELELVKQQNEQIKEHLKLQEKEYKAFLKSTGQGQNDRESEEIINEMWKQQDHYQEEVEQYKKLEKHDGEIKRQMMKAKRARHKQGRNKAQ